MRSDKRFMRAALRLARKAMGRDTCEPRAGAVAVVDEQPVGKAHSATPHKVSAVITALSQAGAQAEHATVYTNIEPCCDSPQPESCLEQLIALRPRRVVVGAARPDSPTLARLREAGIEVTAGVCEADSREINEVYFKYAATGLPFVTVKFAQTLDGRIATATGDSQWISGPASLRLAHQLRREHDAIMVGIGTVLADDPRLTVRLVGGRDPLRVVVDSRLRTPPTARMLSRAASRRALIATTAPVDAERARELEESGAEIVTLPRGENQSGIDVGELLAELGRRRVGSVLVEGGAGIITSLLAARRVDRLVIAIAPKIIGRGIEAIGDLKIARLSEAITFSAFTTRRLGDDVIFDGRLSGD
ncbi:MAG TPA: bifunctional diaminohydroxyphosphoribosylaminopyrimidine deaminase/5-amino-6-(5-phosphoribosylamino)uracil reductase RibD [Blastocatellia bacterium]|nr:bifunctional diaminohydroxyphosphoribosylaminopyrimidine deaminase/5-amino-6-(5-phosphoribosylamino)uracil reductase RibD [Blastocatellia bacterium]